MKTQGNTKAKKEKRENDLSCNRRGQEMIEQVDARLRQALTLKTQGLGVVGIRQFIWDKVVEALGIEKRVAEMTETEKELVLKAIGG